MADTQDDAPKVAQEAAKFLDRDFNQCFTQLRHYDSQLWDVCKFAFTSYTALLGVAIGLYQYSLDKHVDLLPAAIAALGVGALLGLFMFCLTIRNRVYFVIVTRYTNEHRELFLRHKPLGFENVSRMYTNPRQPPFFNWRSSHAWLSYITAALNSVLLAVLVFIALHGYTWRWSAVVLVFLILFAVQLGTAIWYLRSREAKSASRAVFGNEGLRERVVRG